MDGKLLAKARERLAETREQTRREELRRRKEVYSRDARIKEIDARLRGIMAEVFGAALGSGADVKALERESLDLQVERAERLTALGHPADYLDEIADCPKCRDSGYVMGHMCSCLKELYDREVAASLSSLMLMGDESFERFGLS